VLRDRGLQFFHVNEEFPVSASHQLALITSLPFVHTARRYYRLNDRSEVFGLDARYSAASAAGSSRDREDDRTRPFRGSKSRNKVSVGEPAEGSLERHGRPRAPRHVVVVVAATHTPRPGTGPHAPVPRRSRASAERTNDTRARAPRPVGIRPRGRAPSYQRRSARRDPRPSVDRKMATRGTRAARHARVAWGAGLAGEPRARPPNSNAPRRVLASRFFF
jgi:hypothetical protein